MSREEIGPYETKTINNRNSLYLTSLNTSLGIFGPFKGYLVAFGFYDVRLLKLLNLTLKLFSFVSELFLIACVKFLSFFRHSFFLNSEKLIFCNLKP